MEKRILFYSILYCFLCITFAILALSNIGIVIISEYLGILINDINKFQGFLGKISTNSFILISLAYIYILLREYNKIGILKEKLTQLIYYLVGAAKIRYLLYVTLLYLFVLFYFAIKNYDYGYDEAWYVHYALNLVEFGFPFTTNNGTLSMISISDMLPNFIAFYLWSLFSSISLIEIKLLSTGIATFGLSAILYSIYKNAKFSITVLTLFFIVLQPGFGFVASSFFGEIVATGFLFLGIHQLFNLRKVLWSAVFFCVAIQTKMQLLPLIILALTIASIYWKDIRVFKSLILTVVFFLVVSLFRTVPVALHDSELIIKLVKQFYSLGGSYHGSGFSLFTIERLQLFNRLFPISLFILILYFSFPLVKSRFDKFIYLFTVIINLYWIIFFNFVTYRHLFIGIIPLCYLLSLFLSEHLRYIKAKLRPIKYTRSRIVLIAGLSLFLIYGVSTNIIYAYIGYNDGVQFDLDGFESRLHTKIETDNSQQEFYSEVLKKLKNEDVLYTNAPHSAMAFLRKRTFSIDKVNPTSSAKKKKFIIISREAFPGNTQKGFDLVNSMGVPFKIIFSVKDFYLLEVL